MLVSVPSVPDVPGPPESPRVKKTVLLYGLLGGVLIAVLKLVEYRHLVLEHSLQIYGGVVALMFSVVGIWLGQKLTRTRETVVVREVPVRVEVPATGSFVRNEARVQELGMTPRELDILEARAQGDSPEMIAQKQAEMEKFAKMYDNPVINVAITFMEPLPVALIITLVSASVLSRRKKASPAAPAAA